MDFVLSYWNILGRNLKEEDVNPYYGFLGASIKKESLSPSVKKSKFISNIFLEIYFVFAEKDLNSAFFWAISIVAWAICALNICWHTLWYFEFFYVDGQFNSGG